MQAVVLEEFGEPADVLQLRDVPIPEPEAGQVRVRMLASPVNPSDLMMVRGVYGMLPDLPATPGFEGVGVVEAAGPGIYGKFLVGKRVAVPSAETGAWREQTLLAARQAIPIPSRLSDEQAAMFLVNPATAYVMTRKVLNPPAGAWLLQTAANSALGKMVIRLGKETGFRTINVVRRSEVVDELTRLGGDVVIEAGPADLAEKVREATGGKGVSYALDPVGGALGSAVVKTLAPGGRLLLYGSLSGEPLSISPRDLLTATASVEGFWLARWMRRLSLVGKLRLIRAISNLIADGILVADVEKAYPLTEVREAVAESERPGRHGKVLLRIGE